MGHCLGRLPGVGGEGLGRRPDTDKHVRARGPMPNLNHQLDRDAHIEQAPAQRRVCGPCGLSQPSQGARAGDCQALCHPARDTELRRFAPACGVDEREFAPPITEMAAATSQVVRLFKSGAPDTVGRSGALAGLPRAQAVTPYGSGTGPHCPRPTACCTSLRIRRSSRFCCVVLRSGSISWESVRRLPRARLTKARGRSSWLAGSVRTQRTVHRGAVHLPDRVRRTDCLRWRLQVPHP